MMRTCTWLFIGYILNSVWKMSIESKSSILDILSSKNTKNDAKSKEKDEIERDLTQLRNLILSTGPPTVTMDEISKLQQGIGTTPRGQAWKILIRLPKLDVELYERLQTLSESSNTIIADVKRTYQKIDYFKNPDVAARVFRTLNAFCVLRGGTNGINYIQGMNGLMGLLLYHMTELDAFSTFDRVIYSFLPSYFIQRTSYDKDEVSEMKIGMIAGRMIVDKIIQHIDPELHQHFRKLRFPPKNWATAGNPSFINF